MAISISSFSMSSFKQWSRPLKFSSAGNFSKSLMIDPQGLLITELIAISRFYLKQEKWFWNTTTSIHMTAWLVEVFRNSWFFLTSVFLMQSQPTRTIDSWRSLTERSWLDYSTINKRSLTSRWLMFYANERRLVRETFLKKTETITQEYWKLIVYLSTNRLCQVSEVHSSW